VNQKKEGEKIETGQSRRSFGTAGGDDIPGGHLGGKANPKERKGPVPGEGVQSGRTG